MSNASDLQLILDNRINISSETTKVIAISGTQVNAFELSPEGGGNYNSTITWQNVITPSLANTVVSRNIRMRYLLTVTAPAGSAVPPFANPFSPEVAAQCALRSWPLQSICDNISLILNGSTCNINSRALISAFQRTLPMPWLENEGTECPCVPDNSASLSVDAPSAYGYFVSGAAYPAPNALVNVTLSNGLFGQWVAAAAAPAIGATVTVQVYNNAARAVGNLLPITAQFIYTTPVAGAIIPVYLNQGTTTSSQPLSGYYNSKGATRSSFVPVVYDVLNRLVTFEVSESLLISPLTIHDTESYLSNINTLSLTLTYSNLLDMMVWGKGAVIPDYTVAITDPKLELTYIQVSNNVVSIPRLTSYPFENMVFFTQSAVATMDMATLETYTLTSNTVRLQSLPSRMYIFARPTLNTYRQGQVGNVSYADAFLSLADMPNLNISIGNRTGLLSSASAKSIFRICKKNQYSSTFNDFAYGSGSLIVLDPVEDLGVSLDSGETLPGESASINFSISGKWSNKNYVASYAQTGATPQAGVTIELVIAVVYSGVVSLTPDNCVFSIGDVSETEVNALLKEAPVDGSMVSSEALQPKIEAGSLFSKRKSIMGHTAKGAHHRSKGGVLSGGLMAGAGLRRK
jgi:hypothetical protein